MELDHSPSEKDSQDDDDIFTSPPLTKRIKTLSQVKTTITSPEDETSQLESENEPPPKNRKRGSNNVHQNEPSSKKKSLYSSYFHDVEAIESSDENASHTEQDSSESESEVGSEATFDEMKGFIVDEPEYSNKDSSEEEEEPEIFDPEDIALIYENLGQKKPDEEDEIGQKEQPRRRLKKASGTEIPLDKYGESYDNTQNDDGDMNEDPMLYSEVSKAIYQTFHDIPTLMKILRNERPSALGDRITDDYEPPSEITKPIKSQDWHELGEPEEVKRAYLTPKDELISSTDVPERLYLRYQNRPSTTPPEEIKLEAKWITRKLRNDFSRELSTHSIEMAYINSFGREYPIPKPSAMDDDIIEKCGLVLDYLLNQHLEIPFIIYHNRHLVCPPLNNDIIWRIYELDLEWIQLRDRARKTEELVHRITSNGVHTSQFPPIVTSLLNNWFEEEDFNDLNAYFSIHFREKLRSYVASHDPYTSDSPNGSQEVIQGTDMYPKQKMKDIFDPEDELDRFQPPDNIQNDMFDDEVIKSEHTQGGSQPIDDMTSISDIPQEQDGSPIEGSEFMPAGIPDDGGDLDDPIVETSHTEHINELFDIENNVANIQLQASQEQSQDVHKYSDQVDIYTQDAEFYAPQIKPTSIGGTGIIELVDRYKLASHWVPYLLEPEEFADNLESILRNRECRHIIKNRCPEIPCTNESLIQHEAEEWCQSMVNGPFNTGYRVIDVLVKYFARLLATHPGVRSKLRNLFRDVCTISTWATHEGEKKLRIGGSDWISHRLFRINPSQLIHRNKNEPRYRSRSEHLRNLYVNSSTRQLNDIFLEALKHEKKGTLKIYTHPYNTNESLPWRGHMFDQRCKEWHKKDKYLSELDYQKISKNEINQVIEDTRKQVHKSDEEDANWFINTYKILGRAYCYTKTSGIPNVWIHIQKLILKRTLEVELLPMFRSEMRDLLTKKSIEVLLNHCKNLLEFRLDMQPLKKLPNQVNYNMDDISSDDDVDTSTQRFNKKSNKGKHFLNKMHSIDNSSDSDESYTNPKLDCRICSLLLEEALNGLRVNAVVVDELGLYQEHQKFEYLMNFEPRSSLENSTLSSRDPNMSDDVNKLARLLRKAQIDCVCIGVTHIHSVDLHRRINRYVFPQIKKNFPIPQLQFIGLDVAKLWASSCPQAIKESHPHDILLCISMARLLQDPLAEILNLWDEQGNNTLLQMRYHPLQQMLPREKFQQAMEIIAMKVVSKVGVDVNRIRFRPHLMSPLIFVGGLGPRRAQELYNNFLGRNKFAVRDQLLDKTYRQNDEDELNNFDDEDEYENPSRHKSSFGECVYKNCASFLKISSNTSENVDALDTTRLHPSEEAGLCENLCTQAIQDTEYADTDDPIGMIMKHPDLLEGVDYESLASDLLKNPKTQRSLPLIMFMKEELQNPYKEQRPEYIPPCDEEIFHWATNEPVEDFHVGSEVTLLITAAQGDYLKAIIKPSGLTAFIRDKSNLKMELEAATQKPEEGFENIKGKVMFGRISQIDFDHTKSFGYPFYKVDVAVTHNFIRNMMMRLLDKHDTMAITREKLQHIHIHDIHHCIKPLPFDKTKTASRHRMRRAIRHPNFKALSPENTVKFLQDPMKSVGECVFRPSRMMDQLVLMIKTCTQPFAFASFTIEEKDQRIPGELGKELIINGEKFQDLDQIILQFVEPLKMNLEEMYKNSHYRATDNIDTIIKSLNAHSATNHDTIAWALCHSYVEPISNSSNSQMDPLKFFLIVIPPLLANSNSQKSYLQDSIFITPKMFKLWTHSEFTLQKLLEWWKSIGYWRRKSELAEYRRQLNLKSKKSDNRRPPEIMNPTDFNGTQFVYRSTPSQNIEPTFIPPWETNRRIIQPSTPYYN